jgi:hypothetical protein
MDEVTFSLDVMIDDNLLKTTSSTDSSFEQKVKEALSKPNKTPIEILVRQVMTTPTTSTILPTKDDVTGSLKSKL